jgi:hypothetical protein
MIRPFKFFQKDIKRKWYLRSDYLGQIQWMYRLHDMFTGYPDGWGFDITSDRINVRWVRFRNETN